MKRTSAFPRSESAGHHYMKKPKQHEHTSNPPQATHHSAVMIDKGIKKVGKGS